MNVLRLISAEQTAAVGGVLAKVISELKPESVCICLEGDLGAGKTTFARGFLRGCGYQGRVPSPTYTLVEPYDCDLYQVFHMDLYRLQDGAELEFLGISEMTEAGSLLLIEWPQRAGGLLPAKDLEVELKVISEGRELILHHHSPAGAKLAAEFAQLTSELSP
jgi:tRNA threonylcarbamoyladenosine biosynthesis protein TsaE